MVLEKFCACSGLKVNLEKSVIFTSACVTDAKMSKIAGITNMRFTYNLGKYLGFRLYQGHITRQDVVDGVDRVESKMAPWKGRLLVKPVRLVLATAVINFIPSYGMQIQWYPQSICDFLEKTAYIFV